MAHLILTDHECTTFSSNVIILNHAPADSDNIAKSVQLKFFVHDASNIESITIGTAERVYPGATPNIDPNTNSNSNSASPSFSSVAENPPVPAGFGVDYLIGDIPHHGGTPGNPEGDLSTFNPDNANVYIRVPFTITFTTPPEPGFVLYAYAENPDDGVKTAWSHDCGFNQIPEFATIALPLAGVIGLFIFFDHRRKREEE